MKCPKEGCDGRLEVRGTRVSARTGYLTRKRCCTKCKYKETTIEISRDEFISEMELINGLQRLLDKYNLRLDNKSNQD